MAYRKSYDIRQPGDFSRAGRAADGELATDLLRALAIGLIGGIATISAAQKVGEGIEDLQERWERLSEEQREAYRRAVQDATANEIETDYYVEPETFSMQPSAPEEKEDGLSVEIEASPAESFENIELPLSDIEAAAEELDAEASETAGVLLQAGE